MRAGGRRRDQAQRRNSVLGRVPGRRPPYSSQAGLTSRAVVVQSDRRRRMSRFSRGGAIDLHAARSSRMTNTPDHRASLSRSGGVQGFIPLVFALVMAGMSACVHAPPPEKFPYPLLESTPPVPGRLSARFMGVTTILLQDGECSVMVDGFFSRPGLTSLVTGLRPSPERIEGALRRAGVVHLDALFVAHAHHDHAMDAPDVARVTGAVLVGSASVQKIAEGRPTPPERVVVIERDRQTFEVGRFLITAVRSPHSPPLPFLPAIGGEIEQPLETPAPLRAYREGDSFSYLIEHPSGRVLVHTAAGFQKNQYKGLQADVVLLSAGRAAPQGLTFLDEYWNEVVTETQARLVVPVHWDYFGWSLERPLGFVPWPLDRVREALDAFETRAKTGPRPVGFAFMPPFQPIDLGVFAAARAPDQERRRLGGSCALSTRHPAS